MGGSARGEERKEITYVVAGTSEAEWHSDFIALCYVVFAMILSDHTHS